MCKSCKHKGTYEEYLSIKDIFNVKYFLRGKKVGPEQQ